MKNQKIIHNRIKCKKCGDIIESFSEHDFKFCSCQACAVDGGHDYLRRLGWQDDWEEMSEVLDADKFNPQNYDSLSLEDKLIYRTSQVEISLQREKEYLEKIENLENQLEEIMEGKYIPATIAKQSEKLRDEFEKELRKEICNKIREFTQENWDYDDFIYFLNKLEKGE